MARHQFSYKKVDVYRNEENTLGIGSYGAVYRAKCDELPCAAKCLHPVFFQFNDPGTLDAIEKFEQECRFLSTVRHPNIIQYLGMIRDPDSGRPVLLMELMDESLTRFLERQTGPLPYHVQVSLAHDIALALVYLHSNRIVHRDLSSNNVLLIAGSRAKVTDFGMSKLINVNPHMTPLTKCPGTQAYMAPEALRDPPVYSEKLDCFSEGVLIIQITTQKFPDPGPATRMMDDPRSPVGALQVPVPETERRHSHIVLVDPTHPLLQIAIRCLEYRQQNRPSAWEVCRNVAALKEAPQYADSVQQTNERGVGSLSAATEGKEQSREKIKQLEGRNQDLQQQLKCKNDDIQQLRQELRHANQQLQEKGHMIEARERQLQELNQRLQSNEQVTAEFQQKLLQKEKMLRDLEVRLATKDRDTQKLQQQPSRRYNTQLCELCDQGFSADHMNRTHPGCGKDCSGWGYNSRGRFTDGWVGRCGVWEGGIGWYLMCKDCRSKYLTLKDTLSK